MLVVLVTAALLVLPAASSEDYYEQYAGYNILRISRSMHVDDFDVWHRTVAPKLVCVLFTFIQSEYVEGLASPATRERLRDAGVDFEVVQADIPGALRNESELAHEYRRFRVADEDEFDEDEFFEDYRPYAHFKQYCEYLQREYSSLAQCVKIGKSVEKRDIVALRITKGSRGDKKQVYVQGLQHAREWISAATVMYVADRLVKDQAKDGKVKQLLKDVEFLIVPVLNPDGYHHSYMRNRFWRKNRASPEGVDLNRNWDARFGGVGASSSPRHDNYCGPRAFSEPESRAARDFINDNPRIALGFDVHSYGQYILRPYGFTRTRPPLYDTYIEIGDGMKGAIKDAEGLTYTHQSARDLYPVSGTAGDWMYGKGTSTSSLTASADGFTRRRCWRRGRLLGI